MINFSALSSASALGRLARLPLRLVPPTARVRILQGPLRGRRWVAGASNHGCWLGSFEADKQRAFRHVVAPGMVVYDVGANVGFYTLLAAHLVGDGGQVAAFEPVPRNLAFLRQHVALNGLRAVRVHDVALSDAEGTARFDLGEESSMGHLSDRGTLEVRTTTLDAVVARGELRPPDVLKIDVEGAEARVLRGAARTLATARPTILLATHGPAVHAECLALLRAAGYEVASLDAHPVESTSEVLARPAAR
jgi:FkbM family methyltransferase